MADAVPGLTAEQCGQRREHVFWRPYKSGEASMRGADEAPDDPKRDQGKCAITEQKVYFCPIVTGLRGYPRSCDTQRQQPVKQT